MGWDLAFFLAFALIAAVTVVCALVRGAVWCAPGFDLVLLRRRDNPTDFWIVTGVWALAGSAAAYVALPHQTV
jgi:hypothetical protein